MGIYLNRSRRFLKRPEGGFSLLEQLVAAGLIVTASICVLETIAFCLISLQASEEKWEENLSRWNDTQVELSEKEEIYEASEKAEFETAP